MGVFDPIHSAARDLQGRENRLLEAKEYWEERLRQNWGLHGVGYMGYGTPYNGWLYRLRKYTFSRRVRLLPFDFKRAKVLDIGSGTGFWLDVWKSTGVRFVTGSDLTGVAVARLRQSYPEIQIAQIDIGSSIVEKHLEGTFDAVSAFDVLFHITDDVQFQDAIRNISRLLVPGGYFIFSDNFLHGKTVRSPHQVSRALDDWVATLHRFGFHIVSRSPMFVLMNYPVDSRLPLVRILWRCLMGPVHVFPALGHVYGAALFLPDLLLTNVLSEGPTTEMMICRKNSL